MSGTLDGYASVHNAHPLIANAQRRADNEWKRLSTGYACPSVSRTETQKTQVAVRSTQGENDTTSPDNGEHIADSQLFAQAVYEHLLHITFYALNLQ